MKNFSEFLAQLSKSCLKPTYNFKSEFTTEFVYNFFITKNGKKIKFTHKFDGTILENCQKLIFSTANLEIRTLDLAKKLITNIDMSFLSKEGIKIRNIFIGDKND